MREPSVVWSRLCVVWYKRLTRFLLSWYCFWIWSLVFCSMVLSFTWIPDSLRLSWLVLPDSLGIFLILAMLHSLMPYVSWPELSYITKSAAGWFSCASKRGSSGNVVEFRLWSTLPMCIVLFPAWWCMPLVCTELRLLSEIVKQDCEARVRSSERVSVWPWGSMPWIRALGSTGVVQGTSKTSSKTRHCGEARDKNNRFQS